VERITEDEGIDYSLQQERFESRVRGSRYRVTSVFISFLEVQISNFGQQTDYPEWGFWGFSSVPPDKYLLQI
jgi:hypothetical protein